MSSFRVAAVASFVAFIAVTALAQPATQPTTRKALTAQDLHGKWVMDRQATIDRAVASAPEKDKERVREELTKLLPDQSYSFNGDGTYTVTSKPVGDGEAKSDSGEFAVGPNTIRLKSTTGGADRSLSVARDGQNLVFQNALVLKKAS